jgi:hypothetical protein
LARACRGEGRVLVNLQVFPKVFALRADLPLRICERHAALAGEHSAFRIESCNYE